MALRVILPRGKKKQLVRMCAERRPVCETTKTCDCLDLITSPSVSCNATENKQQGG